VIGGVSALTTTSESVAEVISMMRENGKNVPQKVAEIPNMPIPFRSYEFLRLSCLTGGIILQRFSFQYEFNLFSLLASRWETFVYYVFLVTTYLSPVASVVLGFMYTWWWLMLIPIGMLIGMKGMKGIYNKVIFSSAMRSEIEFCLLYFLRQISLTITISPYQSTIYWQGIIN